MLNPDKYIRKSYVDALELATGLEVVDITLAKDRNYPDSYITLHSQSKNRTSISKSLWEWSCRITIDIVSISESGYHNSVSVDDIEEIVLNVIENGLIIPNFNVKSSELVDTVNLPVNTLTQSINRKVVIYQHWLNKAI